MSLYLIRHAQAGERRQDGRDRYRTLAPEGFQRATDLAQLLAAEPVHHIMSSPATRCVQTVGPMATATGLEIQEREELWEGSSIDDVLDLLDAASDEGTVVCSHGDIIPEVIDRLGRLGASITGRGCELGSIWILDHDGSGWKSARYVGRQATAIA